MYIEKHDHISQESSSAESQAKQNRDTAQKERNEQLQVAQEANKVRMTLIVHGSLSYLLSSLYFCVNAITYTPSHLKCHPCVCCMCSHEATMGPSRYMYSLNCVFFFSI